MIYVICFSKIEYIVSSVRLLYLEKDYKIDYIIVIEGMGMPYGTVEHIIADLGMLSNMEDRIGGQQGAHLSWQSCIRARALSQDTWHFISRSPASISNYFQTKDRHYSLVALFSKYALCMLIASSAMFIM
jgi:hypothetical protein